MNITITNSNSKTTVRPKNGRLSKRQVRRAQRVLGNPWSWLLGHDNRDVVAKVLNDGTAEIYPRAQLEGELIQEIDRRGGETGIDHSGYGRKNNTEFRPVEIIDVGESEGRMVVLLRAEGWRYYSCRFGSRPAHVAYLAGFDDNGPWAVRVPGTMETTEEALEWMIPATVQKARDAGRRVLRQGDVYAVETNRAHEAATDVDVDGHRWYARSRVLIHGDRERAHEPLQVPYRCRFVAQRAYEMGRGAGMGYAD